MAEMNIEWQQIERTDNVQEYFWLGEFIQSDRWIPTLPPQFRPQTYPYHKDGFSYNGTSYTFDNEIHVTEMTHATSFESMLSIIEDGGFRSQEKILPGIGSMGLVWFGLKIGEKEIDCMKERSKGEVQRLMQSVPECNIRSDYVLNQIARTPAFQPLSLHGNCKITLGIKEVMHAYRKQFCDDSLYPEMRMLGTFAYRQEIMHTILVCPPNTPDADTCPWLFADPVIQPDDLLETWTWRPHSTGNMHVSGDRSSYIRWEHVSFAFYVPEGYTLRIPDLERCASLCLQRTNKLSVVNDDIRMMLGFIESMEVTERKSVVDTLISMIAAYLKDERLYKKTMATLVFDSNFCVQLEPVVQRIRQLLSPRELEALDWGPLTEWMNSLTMHNNVLRDIQRAEIRL